MLKHYLLVACKVLLRRKYFTLISLTGISLTLMVLIVYSAVVDNFLGKVPPETRCERILGVYEVKLSSADGSRFAPSYPGYRFLTEYVKIHTLPNIEGASVFSNPKKVETVYKGGLFKTLIKRTDDNFWKIYDFDFIAGGPYTANDEKSMRFVAVINRSLQKKLFGKYSGIGEHITVDGQYFRVIGVVKDVSKVRPSSFSEIWAPLTTAKTGAYRNEGVFGTFCGIVLAKDRSDIPLIQREYKARVQRFDYPHPHAFAKAEGNIITYSEFISRHLAYCLYRDEVNGILLSLIITGPMLLFMVLPTLNLININLSRILERSSEIGVRKAFGASSRALAGQFLVENMVITVIGGGIGFMVSYVVLHLVNIIQIAPYTTFRFNGMTFFYGMIVISVFGVLTGVYPAWKMSRYLPVDALRKNPM
jgi:putative ABC transport system permease protein